MEFDMRTFRTKSKAKVVQEHSNPISVPVGIAAFSGIALVGASIGATIGTYVFFGTATLVGVIVVVESQPILKKVARKSNKAIDIAILGASIYAIGALGVTVAASLTFAGLGYTLVYAPYLRASDPNKPQEPKMRYWAYK